MSKNDLGLLFLTTYRRITLVFPIDANCNEPTNSHRSFLPPMTYNVPYSETV